MALQKYTPFSLKYVTVCTLRAAPVTVSPQALWGSSDWLPSAVCTRHSAGRSRSSSRDGHVSRGSRGRCRGTSGRGPRQRSCKAGGRTLAGPPGSGRWGCPHCGGCATCPVSPRQPGPAGRYRKKIIKIKTTICNEMEYESGTQYVTPHPTQPLFTKVSHISTLSTLK